MSKCPDCKGEMKPLFNGEYCPSECDLPPEKRTKSVAKTTSVDSDDFYGHPSKTPYTLSSPGGTDTFQWDGNKWIRLNLSNIIRAFNIVYGYSYAPN